MQETISSLRFGAKAQQLKTNPVRNVTRTADELEKLLEAAQLEKEELAHQVRLLRTQITSMQREHVELQSRLRATNRQSALPVASPPIVQGPPTLFLDAVAAPAATSAFDDPFRLPITRSSCQSAGLDVEEALNRLVRVVESVMSCPLTNREMRDPVVALDGITYERHAISEHLVNHAMCSPITGRRLNAALFTPNVLLKNLASMCQQEKLTSKHLNNPLACVKYGLEVEDIVYRVLDFIDLNEVTNYARVNVLFMVAAYDRRRWTDVIERQLAQWPFEVRELIRRSALPTHMLGLLLLRNHPHYTTQQRLKQLLEDKQRAAVLAPLMLYSSCPKNKR